MINYYNLIFFVEITSERSDDLSEVHPSNTDERSNDHLEVLAENLCNFEV